MADEVVYRHSRSVTRFESTMLSFGLASIFLASAGVAGLPQQLTNGTRCERSRVSFSLPHPSQCDIYFRCEKEVLRENTCEDGLAFDIAEERCNLLNVVDCRGRPNLQAPRGAGNCLRRNGLFPDPESCSKYILCKDAVEMPITCPRGLVFDDKNGVCEFPDVALRPDCMPEHILKFTCPAEVGQDARPFGDHLRFRKADDCRYFFKCMSNGHPRLAGCQWGLVYNPDTGFCDLPKRVKGCEHHYTKH